MSWSKQITSIIGSQLFFTSRGHSIQFEFKAEDLWFGIFFKRSKGWYIRDRKAQIIQSSNMGPGIRDLSFDDSREVLEFWICSIPTFPIHFTFWW